MAILAVGSVAFDAIKTPYGKVDKVLGGSATYFSLAASYFTQPRIVAVVGQDFTPEHEDLLKRRGICTKGIEHAAGQSFFWSGEYGENVNEAKTHRTDLNVFENFNPRIPEDYLGSEFLFLANIDPVLQAKVRRQITGARLVGGDTMNFWINGKQQELKETLKTIDVLLINDGEARALAGESSLPRAARQVLAMGPKALVIKHGEYGATMFFRDGMFGTDRQAFRAPALPIEDVVDPTGAGDSFAGGFMGYLASQDELNRETFKRAMFYGGVMGSFAVERFGPERLTQLTRADIDARFQRLRELTHLD
jgi:sugar/nucleoside kinase (ribokinase family)